jgi:hypothetical protein
VSTDEHIHRVEELLQRLEATRARLDALAREQGADDAVDVLAELEGIAREVTAELERARREAGADS